MLSRWFSHGFASERSRMTGGWEYNTGFLNMLKWKTMMSPCFIVRVLSLLVLLNCYMEHEVYNMKLISISYIFISL